MTKWERGWELFVLLAMASIALIPACFFVVWLVSAINASRRKSKERTMSNIASGGITAALWANIGIGHRQRALRALEVPGPDEYAEAAWLALPTYIKVAFDSFTHTDPVIVERSFLYKPGYKSNETETDVKTDGAKSHEAHSLTSAAPWKELPPKPSEVGKVAPYALGDAVFILAYGDRYVSVGADGLYGTVPSAGRATVFRLVVADGALTTIPPFPAGLGNAELRPVSVAASR